MIQHSDTTVCVCVCVVIKDGNETIGPANVFLRLHGPTSHIITEYHAGHVGYLFTVTEN